MSKFIVVKEAPKKINKGEYLIDTPSFLPQIALHKTKVPRNGLTGLHYIRMIIDSIAQAYDPENMTAYSVKAHNYEGRKFSSEEEMNKIILEMLHSDCPGVFTKYLENKIRNRPSGTSLVIYVDSKIPFQYEQFYKNGLSEVEKEKSTKEQKEASKD
jgi:ribosomal protein S24E